MTRRNRLVLGAVLALVLAAGSGGGGRGDGGALAAPVASSPAKPFPDHNAAFVGCFTGVSAGALISGLPPVSGWIPYSGWHIGVPSMVMRMALGCYTGIIGAALWTTGEAVANSVGGWWYGRKSE